jgi:hypothetical protein
MFAIHRPRLRFPLAAPVLAVGAVAIAGVIQASAQDLPAFSCSDKSGGVAGAAGTVYDVKVAHHDGYDRLVLGFPTTNSMPQYQINRQTTAHFVRDPSGQPATLNGSAGVRVVLRNADVVAGAPTDLQPKLPEIREVAQIGNFERVVSYGIGLATPACFRVLELSGPTRLVIDFQTPADAPAAAATAIPSGTAATAAPSTAGQSATPSDLAATGEPAQPATFPILPLMLGLLAVTAGLTIAGLRRFARK